MISFDIETIDIFPLIISAYLLLINILTFIVYAADKNKAKKNKRRISEYTLITLAVIGGSIGAALGMKIFHHKTKKPKFYVGVPVILILQIFLIIASVYIINKNIISF